MESVPDLADLVGPFYDQAGACTVLSVSAARLDALVACREVLALRTGDGSEVLPAWQFRSDGTLTPHLAAVLDELARGTNERWTWALWLTTPNEDYDGLTASQWLAADRDPTPILREAAEDAARWTT